MRNSILLIALVLFIFACSASEKIYYDYSTNTFDISHVKANLEFLASDDLKGRNTATESEKVASQFIVSEFKKYGLQPFGDDGTYFQKVDFLSSKLDPESHVKLFDEAGKEVASLKLGEDFMTSASSSIDENLFGKDYPVVFAGYGINAPEYDYNDYKNFDVNNKIVIVMTGEPHSESEDYFKGDKNTRYSNPFRKVDMAKAGGAVGLLVIPDEQYLQYWSWLKRRSTRESLSLADGEQDASIPNGLISIESTEAIFENQTKTFSDIEATITANESPQPFELNLIGRFDLQLNSEIKPGRNVVAILPGNNSALADEYITIGAHYDHVGVNADGEVYNGADDNGSGTVAVLEAARLLAPQRSNERPIIFILYTGEEKGLLGSEYFVNNFNADEIVTNINIDMTGRESIDTIHCIGSDRVSTVFHELIKKANAESVNYYLDYSLSDTRLFYQSDHYSFAKENIPVVFFFDNMRSDLHRTTDDVDKINFNKICKTAYLVSKISLTVANLDKRLSLNIPEGN